MLKREFLHVLPPTAFFLISFNVVAFTTSMVLTEFKIAIAAHTGPTPGLLFSAFFRHHPAKMLMGE